MNCDELMTGVRPFSLHFRSLDLGFPKWISYFHSSFMRHGVSGQQENGFLDQEFLSVLMGAGGPEQRVKC